MSHSIEIPSQEPCHLSEILDVWPDYDRACVGYAQSQRRRCRNPISVPNRSRASRLLVQGTALLHSGQENIDHLLEELAPLVLCVRNHQKDAAKMVREWSDKVDKFNQRRLSSGVAAAAAAAAAAAVFPSGSLSDRDTRQQSGGRTFRESGEYHVSAILQEAVRVLQRQMAIVSDLEEELSRIGIPNHRHGGGSSQSTAESESAIARSQPTSNTSQQAASTVLELQRTQSSTTVSSSSSSSSASSSTTTQTAAQQTATLRSAHPQPQSAQPQSGADTSNTQTQRQAPTRRNVVTRKAIEGNCHICFLSLRESEAAAETETSEEETDEEEEEEQSPAEGDIAALDDSVVWCKKQCGYNFHKSCMDSWRDHCESRFHQVTCPMCRSQWARQ